MVFVIVVVSVISANPALKLLVCSCLSCLRRFRHFRDFRRFREKATRTQSMGLANHRFGNTCGVGQNQAYDVIFVQIPKGPKIEKK